MKQIAIEAEIVSENEASYTFKLKTGFGDPVVMVHKGDVTILEEVLVCKWK